MDLGAILLLLGLVILVGIYVGRPLFKSPSGHQYKKNKLQAEKDLHVSTLKAERDRLVSALHELDFDQSLGKVPDDEYQFQRAHLLQRGVDVLKELDILETSAPGGLVSDRIEEVITQRRREKLDYPSPAAVNAVGITSSAPENINHQIQPPSSKERPEDDIEDLIAVRKRQRSEKTAGFCPRCGHPAQKSDRYCSKCGSPLT